MIAYLKRNLHVLHLVFFKPKTFVKTYAHISRLDSLKLLAQQLPFVFLIPVLIIALVGGLFEYLGLKFNWHHTLIASVEGMTVSLVLGVLLGVVFGMVRGVGLGVATSVVGGGIGGVIGSWIIGIPFVLLLGVASVIQEDVDFPGRFIVVTVGAFWSFLIITTVGNLYDVTVGMAVGITYTFVYFRLFYLIIYPILYRRFVNHPIWAHFKKLPFFYDEVIFFRFPLLKRLLKVFVQADRSAGMKAINFIIQERPLQLSQARRALFEIAMHDLCDMQEFRQIAATPQVIGFLQGVPKKVLPKQFESGEPFLWEISQLVAQYLAFTTIYSRKKQLEIIAQKVKDFQLATAYLRGYAGRELVKVAYAWGELATAEEAALQRQIETEPILNPFVVGNPLRRKDKEVFQGREDVARMLEGEIMRDKSMSPLLLYGKRRIGKTSTLLNLRKLLGPKIIPVYLDGQDAGLTQSDAGFLYQTLAKILRAAPREWATADSLILPNRQEFEAHAFELSSKLLKQLRERLQADNARVLLCLDEYERLDRAYEQGRITEDLLDQLRHYIQHETRLAFLFAGAHRMTERRAIRWSDYLINVKTIKLSFLDHASAEKLITAPIPDWPLTYEPGVVEQILQITHRQPYLLQAVASDLVDYLNMQQRTRATMSDLDEAIRRVLVTAELYFQNTWLDDLTEPERALIFAYLRADGEIDPVANKEVLHGLVQNDIFEIIDGRHVFVIDLFKRWILKNLPV